MQGFVSGVESMAVVSAEDLIRSLELEPHPEGGCFREVYRAPVHGCARSMVTSIYYILRAGERSHWHRVDAVELWHYYAGAPLKLRISDDGRVVRELTIGSDIGSGEVPLGVVPEDAWQSAESLGDWTLVGCTVAPAFEFSGFVMAPPGWEPGQ